MRAVQISGSRTKTKKVSKLVSNSKIFSVFYVKAGVFICIHNKYWRKKNPLVEKGCFFVVWLHPPPPPPMLWLGNILTYIEGDTNVIHRLASVCLSSTTHRTKSHTDSSGYVHASLSKHFLLHDVLRSRWGMRVVYVQMARSCLHFNWCWWLMTRVFSLALCCNWAHCLLTGQIIMNKQDLRCNANM